MVAVFFFTEIELYRAQEQAPPPRERARAGLWACLDLTVVRVRVLDWGWNGRRLHRRQDQEHRPAGPLARREDDPRRGHALRLRRRREDGLPGPGHGGHGLRARGAEAEDLDQPRRRVRRA